MTRGLDHEQYKNASRRNKEPSSSGIRLPLASTFQALSTNLPPNFKMAVSQAAAYAERKLGHDDNETVITQDISNTAMEGGE